MSSFERAGLGVLGPRVELDRHEAADEVLRERQPVAGQSDERRGVHLRHLAAAEDPDAGRPLGNDAREEVALEGEVVQVVEEEDRSGLDELRSDPLLQLLPAVAARDGVRLAPEGDDHDGADEEPLAGARPRHRRRPDREPRGQRQARPANRGEQRGEKAGLVRTGSCVEIDDVDAEGLVEQHRRVGEAEGAEGLTQETQRRLRVLPRRVRGDQPLDVGDVLAPEAGRCVVAFGGVDGAVGPQERRRRDAVEGREPALTVPAEIDLRQRAGERDVGLALAVPGRLDGVGTADLVDPQDEVLGLQDLNPQRSRGRIAIEPGRGPAVKETACRTEHIPERRDGLVGARPVHEKPGLGALRLAAAIELLGRLQGDLAIQVLPTRRAFSPAMR